MDLQLNADDLLREEPRLYAVSSGMLDWETFGHMLSNEVQGFHMVASMQKSAGGDPSRPVGRPKPLFSIVLDEIYKFICTEDAKYDSARKKLTGVTSTATVSVVVGEAISQVMGEPAKMITPLVIAGLYGLKILTKNSFCRYLKEERKVR